MSLSTWSVARPIAHFCPGWRKILIDVPATVTTSMSHRLHRRRGDCSSRRAAAGRADSWREYPSASAPPDRRLADAVDALHQVLAAGRGHLVPHELADY